MTLNPPHPQIFDHAVLSQRRRRALAQGAETFLLERVAEDMTDRLGAVLRQFDLAAVFGTPTDVLADALKVSGRVGRVLIVDPLVQAAGDELKVAAREEALPFAGGSLDLAASALSLQFANDLPGALIQIRRALRPDGLFLAAVLGGETLSELRQAFAQAEADLEGGVSPRVAPFADIRDLGALLQRAGFALPVTDIDRVVVRYASPVSLMQDLRRMGATNMLADRRHEPLRRATLARMMEVYGERFADPDGRLRATFDVIWLSGWAPHESQQKPLAPGSARMRLADALGVAEQPAGEKPGENAIE